MRDDTDDINTSEEDEYDTEDEDYAGFYEDNSSTSSDSMELDGIDKIFYQYTSLSEFCIGGKIELNENVSKLFYKCRDGTHKCIDFLNTSEEDINTLISSCSDSSFGFGRQSVVDSNVRQAKELRAKDFSYQFSPQMKSSVTSQIKEFLSGRDFLIQPYKLNIYSEGGHFKKHKDTIKSDKMIASLVICLPILFEGGILTVENEKEQSGEFDWGKEVSLSKEEKNIIQWACFFCSCDHYISNVTKGRRITITYDILTDDSKQDDSDNFSGVIPERYHGKCKEKLQNYIKKLDVNKVYGYFPNHIYRFSDTDGDQTDLRNKLKGNDLLLYDILNQQGWKVILQVYYPDLKSFGPNIAFDVNDCSDDDLSMNKAIAKKDKKKLSKLTTLNLLNNKLNSRKGEIHHYDYCYGYTGNSPFRETKFFYAGTVMVLRSQTSQATAEITKEG